MIAACTAHHVCGCTPGGPSGALAPSVTLLIKLGSLAVHIEEMPSPSGHQLDKSAVEGLLADEEVSEWLTEMGKMAFLPVKR